MNLFFIQQIRYFLTVDTCHQLVQSTVISHLDYGNALYHGLYANTLAPLVRVQRRAAKIVLRRGRYDSATETMKELH